MKNSFTARDGIFGFCILTALHVRVRLIVKRGIQERQKRRIGGKRI